MANNLDISRNDFENICRTCLSREGLNPLYEKYLAEMLTTCTVVKFAENDGLPAKICSNCIDEINNAFSFAKRCETTDKILRRCVIKLETEVANTSSHQIVEPTIKTEVEIQPEIIFQEVFSNYERMEEVKQEENVKMEFEENWMEVQAETKIKCNENDPLVESNEKNDDNELQGKTSQRRCTMSQREENSSKGDDSETYEDPADESYEEEDDDDSSDSRLKRKTFCPQTNEASTNKMGQHKHDQDSKSSNQINEHQKGIHTVKKPHICEVCRKGFSKNQHLKNHLRLHTGEKPYICDVCSKAFSESTALQKHKRIHTGEKPYTCKVCSKTFSDVSNLQCHMRIHTGEKPYTCKVCSKTFSQASILQCHMRIHTGEKPYICDVCSKAFSTSSHLKRHMRIHFGEKPYICDVCS